jgi:acyl-CoA synthetase (AMP-forming)/AMP-acid ligase II
MDQHTYTVYDTLARNASAFGARTALVTETSDSVSYRALMERVDRMAGGLSSAGLMAGDRVVVLAQNCAAYFELYFAAARQGIVLYPLNWRLSAGEIAASLERADARGLIIDGQYHGVLPVELGSLVLKAQFDSGAPSGWTQVSDLYEAGAGERPPVGRDDAFAIISTAAVDVIPRGAVLTHDNVLYSNLQTIAAIGLGVDDANLLFLPLFHVAALSGALAIMHAGGKNIVMTGFDAPLAVRLIDEHDVTFIGDFPPILSTILDQAQAVGSRLPSLKHVNGLDAPATMERLHAETNAEFWTGFGQTETTGFVTIARARDHMGAAGKPGAVSQIKLVDEYDDEVPTGTPGEILVRGPVVFQGYFAQPDVTAHTFRNGWHHTGDVGRFDEHGTLFYVKRKPEKELIKPGGENVYPAEVERIVMELDGVHAVCVFGVPDARWGEAIAAVVEVADGMLTGADVSEHVGSRIARFKRPHHVGFVRVLPREDTGEVDRDAVREAWTKQFSS